MFRGDRGSLPARPPRRGLALAGLLLGLAVAVPTAQAQSNLGYRLDRVEARLAEIQSQLDDASAAGGGGVAGVLSNSPISNLREEVGQLRATVEQLQYQVRQIGEEAARRFSAIQFRLTELEGGDISTLQPVPPLGQEAPAQPPARGAGAAGGQGNNSGAVEPPATGPTAGIVPGPEGQGTFNGVPVSRPGVTEGSRAAVAPAAREELDSAISDVREGRFDRAGERLQGFLGQHPDGPLAGEAWYWLGRSQFARGDNAGAASSFLSGFNADQAGPLAPHNLYQLGVALGRLGQTRDACLTLAEVGRRFPAAPGGIVRQAEAEADSLACE